MKYPPSKRPHTATKIRDLTKKDGWRSGSALYELDPPPEVNCYGFITETRFVVVAFTEHASDHGEPETTIFAAEKDGGLFIREDEHGKFNKHCRMGLDSGSEFLGCRIVGKNDHEAALAKLQGGYTIAKGTQ